MWVAIPFDQVPKMRNAHVPMMTAVLQEAMDKENSQHFQNWRSRWVILFPKLRNKKSSIIKSCESEGVKCIMTEGLPTFK